MRAAASTVFHGLALAFLAGEWEPSALRTRGRQALDDTPLWLPSLVRRVLRRYPIPPVDDEELSVFLANDVRLRRANASSTGPIHIRTWFLPETRMSPSRFPVEPIHSLGDLETFLGLSPEQAAWFTDPRGINAVADDPALLHYRFRWLEKRAGGYRLLEAPKPRLKALQRQVLRAILGKVPCSPVARGFVPGRDVRSYATPHLQAHVVVRMDLRDFFSSVGRARVVAIFRSLGYPRRVALALAGLCTVAAPPKVLAAHPRDKVDLERRFQTNQRLRDPHLPQGAPTSPALANLAAHRLDLRLSALARRFGANLTRYADDLAISGDARFNRSLPHFLAHVGAIVADEGFSINFRKTRIMRQSERQHLCGITVNETPNLSRREYDRLKAILCNSIRHGPASQNREGHPDFRRHLQGKVARLMVVNPAKGNKLRALLARIDWAEVPSRQ